MPEPRVVACLLCWAAAISHGLANEPPQPADPASVAAPAESAYVRPPPGACSSRLDREVLERSLALGTGFLVANQREQGNFQYQYDWRTRQYTPGDNSVRQAGALWGLTLLDQAAPTQPLLDGITRGLAFFDRHSRRTEDGARFIEYPTDRQGALGVMALVTLATIDHLRARGPSLPAEVRLRHHERLDDYLRFLLGARSADGLWHVGYRHESGTPFGPHSPYADGEALLALVKAARYLGRDDLRPVVLEAAEAGYRLNVAEALRQEPDSSITKGYYQWSSMAFFELATSGWEGTAIYGDRVMQLADWMIDVHRTLGRERNTGYAYEGIVHAFELAHRRELGARATKYACTIERGLEKLTSWQVGSPLALPPIAVTEDARARGGVQNHATESMLRIDVTQHQMHAVLLALRYFYLKKDNETKAPAEPVLTTPPAEAPAAPR